MEEIEVTILNWEKYNGRSDIKHPSWFRVQNRVYASESLHGLLEAERWTWLCLLCLASQRGNSELKFNSGWFSEEFRINPQVLVKTIEKLVLNACVTSTLRTRGATDRQTDTTDITEQDTTRQTTSHEVPRKGTLRGYQANPANVLAWEAYREAYVFRYQVEPVRNARVNSLIAQFVKRVGIEDAPGVLRFFLSHNDGFYLKQLHSIGLAVKDAESLRTQWIRGRAVTGNDIRNFEKTDQLHSQLERIRRGEI